MVKWNVKRWAPGMFLAHWHKLISNPPGVYVIDYDLTTNEARNLMSKFNLFKAVLRENPGYPTSQHLREKLFRMRRVKMEGREGWIVQLVSTPQEFTEANAALDNMLSEKELTDAN